MQHFVCAHCEKAFEGRRHYEKKGQAYCERDYKAVSQQLTCVLIGQNCNYQFSLSAQHAQQELTGFQSQEAVAYARFYLMHMCLHKRVRALRLAPMVLSLVFVFCVGEC